jgi:hypothetical protein
VSDARRRQGFSWQTRARNLGRENARWRARCRHLEAIIGEVLASVSPEVREQLLDALQAHGPLQSDEAGE